MLRDFTNGRNLLRKLLAILKNRCSAVTSSPFILILARSERNLGLLCTSAKNSSTFCAPYALPRYPSKSLNNFLSCIANPFLGSAKAADIPAWDISCSIVCVLIPASASSEIVLVFGSNNPATERPSSALRFFLTTTFVSPTIFRNAFAVCRTWRTGFVSAILDSTSPMSPFFTASSTVGCSGRSSPTIAPRSSAMRPNAGSSIASRTAATSGYTSEKSLTNSLGSA